MSSSQLNFRVAWMLRLCRVRVGPRDLRCGPTRRFQAVVSSLCYSLSVKINVQADGEGLFSTTTSTSTLRKETFAVSHKLHNEARSVSLAMILLGTVSSNLELMFPNPQLFNEVRERDGDDRAEKWYASAHLPAGPCGSRNLSLRRIVVLTNRPSDGTQAPSCTER